ncbi:MAG: hypothetical protein IMF06_10760 [Proteobacteria bacterium]|nr:hypothetical protein [Pseudomonadota bacterium]
MKQLTVYSLALLLVIGTTAALAGDRGNGGHNGGHHYQSRGHHGYHYRPYRHYGRHSAYYRPHYNYPNYLGAALLGSALSYSLYHTHNGVSCYDKHAYDRYPQRTGGYSEVVGCHRIERLPDGSERRIEVPLSQCQ